MRKFEIGVQLYEIDPARFGPAMEKLTSTQLIGDDTGAKRKGWVQAKESGLWLVANRGKTALPLLIEYFSLALEGNQARKSEFKNEVLDLAVQKLGRVCPAAVRRLLRHRTAGGPTPRASALVRNQGRGGHRPDRGAISSVICRNGTRRSFRGRCGMPAKRLLNRWSGRFVAAIVSQVQAGMARPRPRRWRNWVNPGCRRRT